MAMACRWCLMGKEGVKRARENRGSKDRLTRAMAVCRCRLSLSSSSPLVAPVGKEVGPDVGCSSFVGGGSWGWMAIIYGSPS